MTIHSYSLSSSVAVVIHSYPLYPLVLLLLWRSILSRRYTEEICPQKWFPVAFLRYIDGLNLPEMPLMSVINRSEGLLPLNDTCVAVQFLLTCDLWSCIIEACVQAEERDL